MTGGIRWPIDDGFAEYPDTITLQQGTIFISPEEISYVNRALAPDTEQICLNGRRSMRVFLWEMKKYSTIDITTVIFSQAESYAGNAEAISADRRYI